MKRSFFVLFSALMLGLPMALLAGQDVFSVAARFGQTRGSELEAINGLDVSIDAKSAKGLSIGYGFSTNLDVELEMVHGGFDLFGAGGTVSGDYDSLGIYAVYRSVGQWFFQAKLGFVDVEVRFDDFNVGESDSGMSYGIGGGYRLNKALSFGAEYTIVDQNLDWLLGMVRFSIK